MLKASEKDREKKCFDTCLEFLDLIILFSYVCVLIALSQRMF